MINMPRLRASMDVCLEQLPTLLKIEGDGAVPITQLLPRVLSQLRALSVYSESGSSIGAEDRLSESMVYVLQKVHLDHVFPACFIYREVVKTTVLEQDPPNHKIDDGLCLHPPSSTSKDSVFIA